MQNSRLAARSTRSRPSTNQGRFQLGRPRSAAGSSTPAGQLLCQLNVGGCDQLAAILKSTSPPVNSAISKLTSPPENCALPKLTVPPENSAPLKWTLPPENSASMKWTLQPENSAPPKLTVPPENCAAWK